MLTCKLLAERELRGILDALAAAIGKFQGVRHSGRCADNGCAVLVLQALVEDLHVQQAQKAAHQGCDL